MLEQEINPHWATGGGIAHLKIIIWGVCPNLNRFGQAKYEHIIKTQKKKKYVKNKVNLAPVAGTEFGSRKDAQASHEFTNIEDAPSGAYIIIISMTFQLGRRKGE